MLLDNAGGCDKINKNVENIIIQQHKIGGEIVNNELKPGLKFKTEMTVTEQVSAKNVGSGSVDVFATPAMIALMEKAASQCVMPYLEEGQSTVGTQISVSHMSATPLGMKVYAEVELTDVQNRKLLFNIEAFDEAGKIGEGTHERFIIDVDRFMSRVNGKIK